MIFLLAAILINADFPISRAYESQDYPIIQFVDNIFYVFWTDLRHYSPDRSIYSARVSPDGVVLDPDGKVIMRDRAVCAAAAYDGVNFLVAVQDSC